MDSPAYEVCELLSGQRFPCPPGQSLLRAMEAAGKRCVPVGCRGGGCGLCKVWVRSGDYRRGRMSGCHVPPEAAAQGLALACQVFPDSDLAIETLPRACAGQTDNKNRQEVSS